jgi:hypothetical protein
MPLIKRVDRQSRGTRPSGAGRVIGAPDRCDTVRRKIHSPQILDGLGELGQTKG